ncbi:MAG: hypothetical protein ACLRFJ_00835 [Alphaproteobacteria bacterium]
MSDLKQQIFQELDNLEKAVSGLQCDADTAGRQTDLEVAILTQQVKNLRAKNMMAVKTIDRSISILERLKAKDAE